MSVGIDSGFCRVAIVLYSRHSLARVNRLDFIIQW